MVNWTISSLKTSARAALARNYWPCVLAGLIYSGIGFSGCGGGGNGAGDLARSGSDAVREVASSVQDSGDLVGVDAMAATALSDAAERLAATDPALAGAVSEAAARISSGTDGSAISDLAGAASEYAGESAGASREDAAERVRPAWFFVAAAAGCMFAFNLICSIPLLIQFFAIGPLRVGLARFFLRSSRDKSRWADLGWGFDKSRYWTVARTVWVAEAATSLWFLVFVVPGFVKSYSWRLVPMLLADDGPVESSSFAVMRRSRCLADGHKMHMLGLDLSFAGWWLLSLLLLFIPAVFFVVPWTRLTDAGLYDTLRSGES